ncbi:MAG: hypothetical protein Q7U29_14305 [Bradyrhizobium sp.]|nr:hypothetical protein [Bradyrhizobium sp.]MDO9297102.1 hypothetical protein [Bradyrhizobium sp.]
MQDTIRLYRTLSDNRAYLRSVCEGAVFLAASGIAVFAAVSYATVHASNPVTDFVLSRVGPYNVRFLFIYGTFAALVVTAGLLASRPNRLPFAFKAMADVLSGADRVVRRGRAARPLSLFDRRARRIVHHPRRLPDVVLAVRPRLRAVSFLRESGRAAHEGDQSQDTGSGRRSQARDETVRAAYCRGRPGAGRSTDGRVMKGAKSHGRGCALSFEVAVEVKG